MSKVEELIEDSTTPALREDGIRKTIEYFSNKDNYSKPKSFAITLDVRKLKDDLKEQEEYTNEYYESKKQEVFEELVKKIVEEIDRLGGVEEYYKIYGKTRVGSDLNGARTFSKEDYEKLYNGVKSGRPIDHSKPGTLAYAIYDGTSIGGTEHPAVLYGKTETESRLNPRDNRKYHHRIYINFPYDAKNKDYSEKHQKQQIEFFALYEKKCIERGIPCDAKAMRSEGSKETRDHAVIYCMNEEFEMVLEILDEIAKERPELVEAIDTSLDVGQANSYYTVCSDGNEAATFTALYGAVAFNAFSFACYEYALEHADELGLTKEQINKINGAKQKRTQNEANMKEGRHSPNSYVKYNDIYLILGQEKASMVVSAVKADSENENSKYAKIIEMEIRRSFSFINFGDENHLYAPIGIKKETYDYYGLDVPLDPQDQKNIVNALTQNLTIVKMQLIRRNPAKRDIILSLNEEQTIRELANTMGLDNTIKAIEQAQKEGKVVKREYFEVVKKMRLERGQKLYKECRKMSREQRLSYINRVSKRQKKDILAQIIYNLNKDLDGLKEELIQMGVDPDKVKGMTLIDAQLMYIHQVGLDNVVEADKSVRGEKNYSKAVNIMREKRGKVYYEKYSKITDKQERKAFFNSLSESGLEDLNLAQQNGFYSLNETQSSL